MIKTSGKKSKKPLLVAVLIAMVALVFITKPLLKREKEVPPTQPIKPEAPEEIPTTEKPTKPEARIAVIIDDVGYPTGNLEGYGQFKGKLTFSVIPFLSESDRYANFLHDSGFEIMIHIPMEPVGYPENNPGIGALFSHDMRKDVEKKLRKMINESPHASGANNHMGSMATQDYELMTWTLSYLKKQNLFFIDSVTTIHSRAYERALDMELSAAKRDIFLDNENNFAYINAQFEKLKSLAMENGTAIGIGHFQNDNLLRVLNYQLPLLARDNIALVFASEAVAN